MEDGDGVRAGAALASLPRAVHEDLVLFISENVRAETLVEGGLGLRQASAERLLAKHSVSDLLTLLRAASLANEEEEVGRARQCVGPPFPAQLRAASLDRSTDCVAHSRSCLSLLGCFRMLGTLMRFSGPCVRGWAAHSSLSASPLLASFWRLRFAELMQGGGASWRGSMRLQF